MYNSIRMNQSHDNNRWRKATDIAAKLFASGVSSQKLPEITEQFWLAIAVSMRYAESPSAECREAIAFLLESFERAVQEVQIRQARTVRAKRPMPARRINHGTTTTT